MHTRYISVDYPKWKEKNLFPFPHFCRLINQLDSGSREENLFFFGVNVSRSFLTEVFLGVIISNGRFMAAVYCPCPLLPAKLSFRLFLRRCCKCSYITAETPVQEF